MKILLLSILAVAMIGLMIPNAFSANPEITITNDSTGGDCTTIGTWNSNTRTCTLTSDVSTPIVITGCGMTLDGNGHTVNIPPQGFNTENELIEYYQKYDTWFEGGGINVHPDGCDDSDTGHTTTIKNFIFSGCGQVAINTSKAGNWQGSAIIIDNMIQSSTDTTFEPFGFGYDTKDCRMQTGIHASGKNILVKDNQVINTLTGISIGYNDGGIISNNIFKTTVEFDGEYYGYEYPHQSINFIGGQISASNSNDRLQVFDNVFDGYGVGIRVSDYVDVYDNTIKNNDYLYGGGNSASSWNRPNYFNNNFINNFGVYPPGQYFASSLDRNYFDISCPDENYDNLCDNDIELALHNGNVLTIPGTWAVPDGWKISISQNNNISQEATSSDGAVINFVVPSATKDGQQISVTCDSQSGSTFSLGTTNVICQTNEGAKSAFSVTVSDTIPPVVSVPSNIQATTTVAEGIIVEYSGVSATDTIGLANSVSCNKESGTLFPIGDTIVTCVVTDTSGNSGSSTFTVSVTTNTLPPTIVVPENLMIETPDYGAKAVNYPMVNATDVLGISEGPTCNISSGSFFNVGTTTVTCTAKNTAGFVSSESFTVTVNVVTPTPEPEVEPELEPEVVVDSVVPQVLVPDDMIVQTSNDNGEAVIFNPQAIDNVDAMLIPICNHSSGSVFPIGITVVTCTATDTSGNSSTNSFSIIVEKVGFAIPNWVKNVAGFWNAGDINDQSFLEGIQYLIQNDIIIVPETEAGSESSGTIPEWVKNTAGWWATGQIDDVTFVNGIQFLIQAGLIQVS